MILTDDVGFGASSTFGGPIATPTLDSLARNGLRYNRFHTTAICSPTRASLLTGRTPHHVGVGLVTNLPTGYPGYNSVLPKSAATIAQVLRSAGWSTAMFGKSHITPEWETGPAGPFDRWPTGLGFDYFYGFLGADTSAFDPWLVENTRVVRPSAPHDGSAYHLEADLADHAIEWLETQHAAAPQKPVFIYYASGAAHAPNHAPADWVRAQRGKFDEGWDELRRRTFEIQKNLGVVPADARLTPRPEPLPAWESLSADRRAQYSKFMEAYAASLAYSDAQVGRVIDALRRLGRLDNTLVIFIEGDNGSSMEGRMHGRLYEQSGVNNFEEDDSWVATHIDELGSAATYPLVPGGWGWALNAPFPWGKRVASHLGGTRNGLVISWPQRIKPDSTVRTQYHHVADIMPTILDATGVAAPRTFAGVRQMPLDGISMTYTFDAARAADRRTSQIFEIMENMALYRDGWLLSSSPTSTPWDTKPATTVLPQARQWELYDLRNDFSQSQNLAGSEAKRLKSMQQSFWREAARAQILPIHPPTVGKEGIPSPTVGRKTFDYTAATHDLPESVAPPIMRRKFSITTKLSVPSEGAHGVLVAQGGRYGGYALHVQRGIVVFTYNAVPPKIFSIRATRALAVGAHEIVVNVTPDSSAPGAAATVKILIDGVAAGDGRIERTMTAWMTHTEGFDVGVDHVTAVTPDYEVVGSRYNGAIERVRFTLD